MSEKSPSYFAPLLEVLLEQVIRGELIEGVVGQLSVRILLEQRAHVAPERRDVAIAAVAVVLLAIVDRPTPVQRLLRDG